MLVERRKKITILTLTIMFLAYSAGLYISLPVPVTGKNITEEADKGKFVWQQYNCVACHQLYGLGGYLGPDLTNNYSLRGPDYIRAFLKTGTATMPNFHLSEQEIKALLGYLENIDASGNADPRTFITNIDGTIEQ